MDDPMRFGRKCPRESSCFFAPVDNSMPSTFAGPPLRLGLLEESLDFVRW
jgi:hypothetical protein